MVIYFGSNNKILPVIITKNRFNYKKSRHSLAVAAKPLVYFTTIFGSQLIKYTKNDITKVNILNKLYGILVPLAMATMMLVIRPISWHDTRKDIPLNILTKTYGLLNILEAIYSVFIIPFGNSKYYVKLFKKLDSIDKCFETAKVTFKMRRVFSIFLIFWCIILVSFTFWLRKFEVVNLGAHLSFFLLMFQGTIFIFFIVNIHINQLLLNDILIKRIFCAMPTEKKIIHQDKIRDYFMKKIFNDKYILPENYCWFELMQIYDKVADCLQLFNDIYSGQVFIMYNSWLLCTLLIICRSLSPTIKYADVFLSDLFLYICINSRPMFLACIGELFTIERKKTLSLLIQTMINKTGDDYSDQIRTMIMLVESRALQISANVYTVNVPTVMTFAGRIISYTVLMIEYFYMHSFLEDRS